MDSNNLLPLLGLALRGGNLAVGEEPVEAAARARDARVLLLAADAAENTRRRTAHFAEAGQCLWLRLPFTKAELGRATGRTAVALVAVTDIGLANAAVRKLAALDPVQYGEAADRLELKAQRAAERRAEQLAHEKNRRTGKRKSQKAPPDQPPALEPSRKRASADGERPRKAPPRRSAGPRRSTAGPPGRRDGGHSGGRLRPGKKAGPYAHSRPVKKGKGSFRKKEG